MLNCNATNHMRSHLWLRFFVYYCFLHWFRLFSSVQTDYFMIRAQFFISKCCSFQNKSLYLQSIFYK